MIRNTHTHTHTTNYLYRADSGLCSEKRESLGAGFVQAKGAGYRSNAEQRLSGSGSVCRAAGVKQGAEQSHKKRA
jgi:hypothetical protein